jgi:hypothetical protein
MPGRMRHNHRGIRLSGYRGLKTFPIFLDFSYQTEPLVFRDRFSRSGIEYSMPLAEWDVLGEDIGDDIG